MLVCSVTLCNRVFNNLLFYIPRWALPLLVSPPDRGMHLLFSASVCCCGIASRCSTSGPGAECTSNHSMHFFFLPIFWIILILNKVPVCSIHLRWGEAESSPATCHSTADTMQPWQSAVHEIVKTEVLLNSVTLTSALSRGVHWSGMMRLLSVSCAQTL